MDTEWYRDGYSKGYAQWLRNIWKTHRTGSEHGQNMNDLHTTYNNTCNRTLTSVQYK